MAKADENKVKGKVDKMKGEAKEQYGKFTDNAKKQAEGKMDKAKGHAKEKASDIQDTFKK